MPAALRVIAPGLLTTVQDAGRPDLGRLGVPIGGACDPIGLAVANLLVGNPQDEAGLECTLLGPELVAEGPVVVGLGGADLRAVVSSGHARAPAAGPSGAWPSGARPSLAERRRQIHLQPGQAIRLEPGDRLSLPGIADPSAGCRAYVAIRGGLEIPVVLGSRSTCLAGGFGGFDGRPLRAGDRLVIRDAGSSAAGRRDVAGDLLQAWPADLALPPRSEVVRVLPAPALGDPADLGRAMSALVAAEWRVSPSSDRRGLRLDGPVLPPIPGAAGGSQGVLPGTIQVTPTGTPLVLLADAGTTGGYPPIAIVIGADLGGLGQAGPGARLRFAPVDLATARRMLAEQRELLARAERVLGRA